MLDSVKRKASDRVSFVFQNDFQKYAPQTFFPLTRTKPTSKSLRYKPFETGEHIQIVDTAIPALTGTLNIRGLPITLGEISALPDFYAAPSDLYKTDTKKLSSLLSAMRTSAPKSEADWARLDDNYFSLKENNAHHFAPGNGNDMNNNRDTFQRYYSDGLKIAKINPEQGSLYTGWSMHFLTDAFSSGHLFNKSEVMRAFDANMKNPQIQEKFFDQIASALIVDKSVKPLANYEVNGFLTNLFGFKWISGAIDTKEDLKKLLHGIYASKPDLFANLSVAALHDSLNNSGVDVENARGESWHAYGDSQLSKSPQSTSLMQKAIKNMVDTLEKSKKNQPVENNVQDIWSYVPHPTETSGKPFVEAEIKALTNPLNVRLQAYVKSKAAEFMPTLIENLVAQGYLKKTGKKDTSIAEVNR